MTPELSQDLDQLLRSCRVRLTAGTGSGGGVFVAPGYVLTCAHVVDNARELEVRHARQVIRAHVEATSPAASETGEAYPYPDLAVVRLDREYEHDCVWLSAVRPRLGAVKVYSYSQVYTLEPEPWNRDARIVGETGRVEAPFFELAGTELSLGMSGGPVLDQTSGRVTALVKKARALDSDRGGLVTPVTGIYELGVAGELLWRAHDEFHARSSSWAQRRQGLAPVGILASDQEARLFGLLARWPPDTESPRRLVSSYLQAPLSANLHPVLRTLVDAIGAAPGNIRENLRDELHLIAGRLGQDDKLRKYLPRGQVDKNNPEPRRPKVDRVALVIAEDHDRPRRDRLSTALRATRAGHFEVDTNSFYEASAVQQAVSGFVAAAASTEVSLLYLCAALAQDDAGPVLVPAPDRRWRTKNQAWPLSSLGDILRRASKDARLVVLLDYQAEGETPGSADQLLRAALPNRKNLIIIALQQVSDRAGLDQVMRGYLTGRHAHAVYDQDVTLAAVVGWLADHESRLTLIGDGFDGTIELGAGPLDPDEEYVRDVLGVESFDEVTRDPRRLYRLSNPNDSVAVGRDVEKTLAFWKLLRRQQRAKQTLITQLLKQHDEWFKVLLESQERLLTEIANAEHLERMDDQPDRSENQARSVAAQLEGAARPWYLLGHDDLKVLADEHGDDVARRAARAGNVKVVTPLALPRVAPLPGLNAVHDWLTQRNWRHLLDLAAKTPGSGSIATGWLTDPTRPAEATDGGVLDGTAIRAVLDADRPIQRDDVRETLGLLAELAPGDLRVVFLYEIATLIRQLPAPERQPEHLLELGFADADARLIGFSIGKERENADVDRLAELARRPEVQPLLRTLDEFERRRTDPGAPGLDLVRALAGKRINRVHELLNRIQASDDDPWPLLAAAERVASDVPALEAVWAQHPPAPVQEIQTELHPAFVDVSWHASASAGPLTYEVFRGRRDPPDSRRPGQPVASGLTGTRFVDREAPANVPLWYLVRCVRHGVPSEGTSASKAVRLLPPVSELGVTTGDARVRLSWTEPDAVSHVRVERRSIADGTTTATATTEGQVHDTGLANGSAYTYRLIAVYEGEDGKRRPSPEVESDPVVPRLPLRRLPEPVLALDPERPDRLVVSGIPDGPTVSLLTSTEPFVDEREFAIGDLERRGRLQELRPGRDRPSEVPAPLQDSRYAFVDIAGDRALVGDPTWWGPVPSLTGEKCSRRGDRVEVFWDQKRDTPGLAVSVGCSCRAERIEVTAGAYIDDWPVLLPATEDELWIELMPYRREHSADRRRTWTATGVPKVLTVPACARVRYRVVQARRGPGRRGRSATVVLEADRRVTIEHLDVVVLPGDRHPISVADAGRAEGGRSLSRDGLVIGAGAAATVDLGEISVRSRVRCFTTDPGIALVHPPVGERGVGVR